MLHIIKKKVSATLFEYRLPFRAKAERRKDQMGFPESDPGIEQTVQQAITWLEHAQDNSRSHDGGVARDYSLITGWGVSYPETTGYIVPTMLNCSKAFGNEILRDRAKRMLDWLVSIQMPSGAFHGGTMEAKIVVPVAFNTGQILMGLAVGARVFREEKYRNAMRQAADWLAAAQDEDGSWRQYQSPFARPGAKTYDTHIAWGLLEAANAEPEQRYVNAALANVKWALLHQHKNGWFENCCLTDLSHPLTHTIGYALRGTLEAYEFTKDEKFLHSSKKTADGLLQVIDEEGFLPGRLCSDWSTSVSWSCLTGTVQIAICWLMLYCHTGDTKYRDAAYAANRYVRRTVKLNGGDGVCGGIKGSFPIDGDYNRYRYLNWACKFFIDSNMFEKAIREEKCNVD